MTTTHLTTAPPTDVFNSGVGGAPLITSAGVDVDNSLVSAILAAAAANGVTLVSGAGGGSVTPGVPRLAHTVSGAPTTGAWTAGDLATDATGGFYECTASGTPGTWSAVAGRLDRIVNVTGAYTAAAGDLVLADATGGAFSVTLPAIPAAGQRVGIKNIGTTNIVTVVAAGKTIEGDANATLEGQWAGATFEYDGANWFVQATR